MSHFYELKNLFQDEEVDILGNIIEEEEPAAKKLKSTMNQVQCKDRVILRSTSITSGHSRSLKDTTVIFKFNRNSELGIFQLRILWSFSNFVE